MWGKRNHVSKLRCRSASVINNKKKQSTTLLFFFLLLFVFMTTTATRHFGFPLRTRVPVTSPSIRLTHLPSEYMDDQTIKNWLYALDIPPIVHIHRLYTGEVEVHVSHWNTSTDQRSHICQSLQQDMPVHALWDPSHLFTSPIVTLQRVYPEVTQVLVPLMDTKSSWRRKSTSSSIT